MTPVDHAQRERALDPSHSFIVQAPAGSGKTELLIQRYLRLLGGVRQPESVVAITFTKKASAEMQRRVLEALADARKPAPDEAYKRNTWELARAVVERDRQHGWQLAENPRRLAIRTIDSLCVSIVGRMPWLSRLGPRPQFVEDASEHYREAAQRTVDLLEEDRYGDWIEPLLRHVDNKQSRLVKLLAEMLACRDQWLRHVVIDRGALRERIEALLLRDIEDLLERLRQAMPAIVQENAVELLRHAARNLAGDSKQEEIQACAHIASLPSARAADLPYWRALAALLLTAKGELRRAPKGINKSLGFPTTSPLKALMCKTVDELVSYREFHQRLAAVSELPAARFDEAQWAVLEALLEALPAAAAQLRLVFAERGQVDFAELSQAALQALGHDDSPSDLAFALDGRIEHLLVDEFQDTSYSQMELLRRLTREWTPGDGRTLFLVGDPMQSIYRFREAEVGLFLRTVREGLPAVHMESLRLSVNFRSRSNIVDWVNRVFPGVFAAEEDIALGAVRFSPSTCASGDAPGPAVQIHPAFEPEGAGKADKDELSMAEANRVLQIVEAACASAQSVAILARSRTHLPPILSRLRKAGVRYSAVEIDPLATSPAVRDLLALTAALLHPGDRVAWLAILRAPWCGLSLADLHALAADEHGKAIGDLLGQAERIGRLSPEGQARLDRLMEALGAPRPRTLRAWVEGVWLRLGGPATIATASGLDDAEAYFDLLEKLDQGCDVDLELLTQAVGRLYAAPDPAAGQGLQVMTIHKAKGLEFDVVILPGLGQVTKTDEEKLMAWLERPGAAGGSEILLAPSKSANAGKDAIYSYVQRLEKDKSQHELSRLLYVAVTRARRELHLLGTAKVRNGDLKPEKRTLLSLLWGAVREKFEASPGLDADPAGARPEAAIRPLRRLAADWAPRATLAPPSVEPREEPPRRWRDSARKRRLIGTVIHDVLQEIGREGSQSWDLDRALAARPRFEGALRAAGLPAAELVAAAAQVEEAIVRAIQDERGRWILDSRHEDARSEAAFAGVVDGRVNERRIDRTFIDGDGVRWVIDFKTTPRKRGDIEGLVRAKMERYRQQMEDYRALYRGLEDRPVRIGLYFPLLGVWREYEESAGAAV